MPQNTPRGYTYELYPDVNNFPAQIQDFATDVDLDVAAQVTRINTAMAAPSARVSATANQAIAANTPTFVTFATEDYDNAAMGNLGVNNDRLTTTSTGIYLIEGTVTFASNGNASVNGRQLAIAIGGVNQATDSKAGSQNNPTEITVCWLHNVTVIGTFFRLEVTHSSAAALNITNRSLSATKVVV